MKLLPLNTQLFFKKAVSVAEHYGFHNMDDLQAKVKGCNKSGLDIHKHRSPDEHFDHHVLASVLKHYTSTAELKKMQPVLFYTPSLIAHRASPDTRISALTLNAIGTHDPLSDVVVLKGVSSILDDLGIPKYKVRVNSIGDSDSSARFIRETSQQLRQRMNDLPRTFAEKLQVNPGDTIAMLYERRHPVIADLPSPLEFLTAPSRKYFKEVLELLENTGIPYELDDRLYGDHNMYAHTIFEFVEPQEDTAETGETLARGGRYDNLTKKYVRAAVPSIGMVMAFQTKEHTGHVCRPRKRKPNACLIHIGREARIRSIAIVDTFRKEKIPIEQCLQYERFSEQVAYAQAHNTKYMIIIGQREARNDVVLVRNSEDRSQQTVSIDSLPQMFRTLV